MIHRYTDQQLREMGVAEYHIKHWHEEETIDKAIEQTKKDFQMIAKIFGFKDDFSKDVEKVGSILKDNFK